MLQVYYVSTGAVQCRNMLIATDRALLNAGLVLKQQGQEWEDEAGRAREVSRRAAANALIEAKGMTHKQFVACRCSL